MKPTAGSHAARDERRRRSTSDRRRGFVGLRHITLPLAWAAVILVAAVASSGGCGGKPNSSTPGPTAGQTHVDLDNLDVAFQFFDQLDVPPNIDEAPDIDPRQIRAQVMYHLDRWADRQPPDDAWIVDPLVRRLPRELQSTVNVDELKAMRFSPQDVHALQEAFWFRALSEWITQRPGDDEFGYLMARAGPVSATDRDKLALALRALDPALDRTSAPVLASALRLFDWAVRSIQLEPLLAYPKDVAGPQPDAGSPALPASTPPPARAIPGPGYQRYPWQVLLHGRGDAWERARVFVLLCRQQGIDAVVLGFDTSDPPQPWVAAVLVAGRLYLFDTALGLPLPGRGGAGIATLDQLIADPALLRQLDVAAEPGGEPLVYPVQGEDLAHVVALVDATPQSLSQRMRVLERNLTGERRMVLADLPSRLARALAEVEGIHSVRLWNAPFETILYREALAKKVDRDEPQYDRDAAIAHFAVEGPFSRVNSLVKGRQQQLRGVFETQDSTKVRVGAGVEVHGRLRGALETVEPTKGAIGHYMDSRMPDSLIRQIPTSPQLQQELGLAGMLPPDEASRQQALAVVVADYYRVKRTAGLWLGQVHFEQSHYHDAVYWFQLTRDAEPDGWWEPGARYDMARAYESLGDVATATELYLGDDSPQRHGNRLRARLLQPSSSATGEEAPPAGK